MRLMIFNFVFVVCGHWAGAQTMSVLRVDGQFTVSKPDSCCPVKYKTITLPCHRGRPGVFPKPLNGEAEVGQELVYWSWGASGSASVPGVGRNALSPLPESWSTDYETVCQQKVYATAEIDKKNAETRNSQAALLKQFESIISAKFKEIVLDPHINAMIEKKVDEIVRARAAKQ